MDNAIYFDNAATSFPKPPEVSEAVLFYLEHNGCNVGRGSYEGAIDAENRLFDTRHALKELFNACDESNVIFTPGDTWGLNMLIKGIARPGDVFITTSMEHNAVMRPLYALKKSGLISLITLPCESDGTLSCEALISRLENTYNSASSGKIPARPRVLIMTHGSNVTGSLLPVETAGAFCRAHDMFLIVDAAQTAGLVPIDVQKMNIDGLCFSGHKSLLGPQGIGGIILSDRMAAALDTVIAGGTGSDSHLLSMPEYLPDRFEPGTLNIPGIYGLGAGLNHLLTLGVNSVFEHEYLLTEHFVEKLSDTADLTIYHSGPLPVVSIGCARSDPAVICRRLAEEYGIWTRSGLHCAPEAHRTIGTYPTGTVRFSFGHLNTIEEVETAVHALKMIISK